MTQLLITLYLMFFSATSYQSVNVSVPQQVYSPVESSVLITLPTPSPTPTPEATPTPTPAPSPKVEDTPLDYVQELRTLGFIRNEFEDQDLNIRNGVVRFQATHNLVVDGDFGPLSTAALRKRLKDTNFQFTDTVQNPPSKGKWILINKSLRNLTLYEGKNVIKKYPVAVGNPPSLTPVGQYKIANRIVNPSWGGGGYAKPVEGGSPYNPLGYRWIGLNIGGGGEYGIHGNAAPYSIGTDASHGCVRMINSDVEELFETVSVGNPVWITTNEGLEALGVSQPQYGGN